MSLRGSQDDEAANDHLWREAGEAQPLFKLLFLLEMK